MKKITLLILTIFTLISCFHKKDKKVLSKKEKISQSSSMADSELEFENEKISLISIMREIPKDSVKMILKDYYSKYYSSIDIEDKYTEEFIDTISRNRKMSRQKVASIIFNFKYEMRTKQEIEQEAIENYEEFKIDEGEKDDPF